MQRPKHPPARPAARPPAPLIRPTLDDSRQMLPGLTESPPPEEADERVRLAERELRREHVKTTVALEERFNRLLEERNAEIRDLREALRVAGAGGPSPARGGTVATTAVETAVGHLLPESMLLGATLASAGPVVCGSVELQSLGTMYEIDRILESPKQATAFFRNLFAWGPHDAPWRGGKKAFEEVLQAFAASHSVVHVMARIVCLTRVTLPRDCIFSPSYLELLDALKAAGRPSDVDLFVLDCGGTSVVSSVVAGGSFFLITTPPASVAPGENRPQPWQLARIGAKRFRAVVSSEPGDAKGGGVGGAAGGAATGTSSEARMLKCSIAVLEGALTVLLKMHLNLTAFPGETRYTQVPLRSKVFARVAAVEGAAEFLVEHGWADDGNKIVFGGSAKDVDDAVEALERMTAIVARRRQKAFAGLVVVDGGSCHGTSVSWNDWKQGMQSGLYRTWLQSVRHRSLMVPLRVSFRELHSFVPDGHPLKARLRLTVLKGTARSPPVTDVVFVCADDMGTDLVLRVPHGFVPVARQARDDRSPVGTLQDLASLPSPPRDKGHRREMVLCFKTGSSVARPPVCGVRMQQASSVSKADESVRCVCGASIPVFNGSHMVISRARSDHGEGTLLRSITAVRPLHAATPRGYEAVVGNGATEPFNFDGSTVDVLHIAVKIE